MNLIEKNNFIEFLKREFGVVSNNSGAKTNNSFIANSHNYNGKVLNTILNVKFDNDKKEKSGKIITIDHFEDIEDQKVNNWQKNYHSSQKNLLNNLPNRQLKFNAVKNDYSDFANKLSLLSVKIAASSFTIVFCFALATSLVVGSPKISSNLLAVTNYPLAYLQNDRPSNTLAEKQLAITYEIDKSILSDYIKMHVEELKLNKNSIVAVKNEDLLAKVAGISVDFTDISMSENNNDSRIKKILNYIYSLFLLKN